MGEPMLLSPLNHIYGTKSSDDSPVAGDRAAAATQARLHRTLGDFRAAWRGLGRLTGYAGRSLTGWRVSRIAGGKVREAGNSETLLQLLDHIRCIM
jgi:hypothetical protein